MPHNAFAAADGTTITRSCLLGGTSSLVRSDRWKIERVAEGERRGRSHIALQPVSHPFTTQLLQLRDTVSFQEERLITVTGDECHLSEALPAVSAMLSA